MFKKFISALLSATILFGLFYAIPVSAENLFTNSGFENGITGWTRSESDFVATGKSVVEGRAALKVVNRMKEWSTPQQFVELKHGKTYHVSMWVKTESSEAECKVVAEVYKKDGTKSLVEICTEKIGPEWTNVKSTFTFKHPEAFEKVKVYSRVVSLQNLYFDDMQLFEVNDKTTTVSKPADTKTQAEIINPEKLNTSEQVTTKVNLIKNSDFEEGTKGFASVNTKLELVKADISGASALHAVPGGTGAYLSADVNLIRGRNYTLYMWYKGGPLSVQLGDEVLAKGEHVNDWKLITKTFTYDDIKKNEKLLFKGDGEYYLDAVSLYELPVIVKAPSQSEEDVNNLLVGGGFENGKDGWTATFDIIQSGEAHSGGHMAVARNRVHDYDGPQQKVTVKPKTEYRLSAWVMAPNSTETVRAHLKGTGIPGKDFITLKKGEWTYFSEVYNTGNNTECKTEFHSKGLSDLYFDDISLVECTKDTASEITEITDSPEIVVNPGNVSENGAEYAYSWDFSCKPGTAHILSGWVVDLKPVDNIKYYSIKAEEHEGKTKLNIITPEASISTLPDKPLSFEAEEYPYISIKGKAEQKNKARLTWINESGGKTSVVFSWNDYAIIDLSGHPDWKGRISRLTFEPVVSVDKDQYGWAGPAQYVTLEKISVFSHNSPEKNSGVAITRADFVDMLVDGLEMINYGENSPFHDASPSAPWYESLITATEAEIIKGDGSGYFRPSDALTREHAAIMLVRACNYFERNSGLKASEYDQAVKLGFVDSAKTGELTAEEAEAMIEKAAAWINGAAKDGIFISASDIATYDVVRITVADPNNGLYTNPYDADEVKADAIFKAPDGSELVIPGYFDMMKDYQYDPRRQVKETNQSAEWKFRFAPTMAGEWSFKIRLTHNGDVNESDGGKIRVSDSHEPGFLRPDKENARIVYDDGTPFFGFGLNIYGPTGADGSNYVTYEKYYDNYARDNGMNLCRIWLDPPHDGLETYDTGTGRFDSVFAGQIDYLMRVSQDYGVKLILSLKTFHSLSVSRDGWLRSQYYSFRGGPLDFPTEVYSNEEAIDAYKDLMRFVIARYSAFDNVLLWEFWNEEDGISGWRSAKDDISLWHDEMLSFAEITDPYNHIIGSSLAAPAGDQFLFEKELTDYTTVHSYTYVQPALNIRADAVLKKQLYGNKPNIIEEFSIYKDVTDKDPEGSFTHEALWSSLAAGTAATTPPWWWDTWLEKYEHWTIFGPVAKFMKDFNWPDTNVELVNFPANSAEKGDYIIPTGYYRKIEYGETPYGTNPVKTNFEYDFTKDFVRDPADIIFESTMLQNTAYTIKVNVPEATNLIVATGGKPVAEDFGGELQITVDEEELFKKAITDEGYITKHTVLIPAGEHTVTVANASSNARFFLAWIAFENVTSRIAAEAAIGDNNGVLLVRDTKASFADMIWSDYKPIQIVGATVELTGLAKGSYEIIWWDTYEGVEVSRQEITVSDNAPLVEVPTFSKDIAAKIIRKSY